MLMTVASLGLVSPGEVIIAPKITPANYLFFTFFKKILIYTPFLCLSHKKSLDSYKQFSDDLFLAFHSKKFDDTYLRNSFLMLVSPLLMVSYGVTRGGPPSPSLDAPV